MVASVFHAVERRAMECDSSAEEDEFHCVQMEQFAFQAEEKMEYHRSLYNARNSEEEKIHAADWSISKRANYRIYVWSLHLKFSAYEAIGCERHRLQNQESYLSQEALRRDSLHQQRMVHLQKQLDEASKQCQEETKSLSEDTTKLPREIDESNKISRGPQ